MALRLAGFRDIVQTNCLINGGDRLVRLKPGIAIKCGGEPGTLAEADVIVADGYPTGSMFVKSQSLEGWQVHLGEIGARIEAQVQVVYFVFSEQVREPKNVLARVKIPANKDVLIRGTPGEHARVGQVVGMDPYGGKNKSE